METDTTMWDGLQNYCCVWSKTIFGSVYADNLEIPVFFITSISPI